MKETTVAGQPTATRKERIDYLDLFRCFSILAVIIIHATSQPMVKLDIDSTFYPIYFVLNSGSQFAVPSFLFLSAVVLFYNYGDRWEAKSWIGFFRKRLTFIIIPYLLWSVFYFVLVAYFNHTGFDADSPRQFLDKLLHGTNYAHLYYIIVIVQFYVLFPFLMTLVRKFPALIKWLIPIGIIVQLCYFFVQKYVLVDTFTDWWFLKSNSSFFVHLHQSWLVEHMKTWWLVKSTGSFFVSYWLFYMIGAYIGLNYKRFIQKAWSHRFAWWGLWAVFAVVYLGKGWLRLHDNTFGGIWIIHINFLTYYTYVSFCCVALLLFSQLLHQSRIRILPVLVSWGATSFGIYFMHPAVLLAWRHLISTSDPIGYHLAIAAGFALALLLSWFACLILKRIQGSWILTGK